MHIILVSRTTAVLIAPVVFLVLGGSSVPLVASVPLGFVCERRSCLAWKRGSVCLTGTIVGRGFVLNYGWFVSMS